MVETNLFFPLFVYLLVEIKFLLFGEVKICNSKSFPLSLGSNQGLAFSISSGAEKGKGS